VESGERLFLRTPKGGLSWYAEGELWKNYWGLVVNVPEENSEEELIAVTHEELRRAEKWFPPKLFGKTSEVLKAVPSARVLGVGQRSRRGAADGYEVEALLPKPSKGRRAILLDWGPAPD
jgi:hypothetical protein